jgi:hypothetical protein
LLHDVVLIAVFLSAVADLLAGLKAETFLWKQKAIQPDPDSIEKPRMLLLFGEYTGQDVPRHAATVQRPVFARL